MPQADSFKAAAYTEDMKQPDKVYLRECIPDFFKPHGSAELTSGPLAACTRRPSRIDFIHAPFFRWQADVSAALTCLYFHVSHPDLE